MAMGSMLAGLMPSALGGRNSVPGAFGGRKRKGPVRSSGSKLWRKHHREGDDVGRMRNNVRGY